MRLLFVANLGHKAKGFSLLEFLIVLALVSILATLAIPCYQDYLVRARVYEGLSLAVSAQMTVVSNANYGKPLALGYQTVTNASVSNISISEQGVVTISYTGLGT